MLIWFSGHLVGNYSNLNPLGHHVDGDPACKPAHKPDLHLPRLVFQRPELPRMYIHHAEHAQPFVRICSSVCPLFFSPRLPLRLRDDSSFHLEMV